MESGDNPLRHHRPAVAGTKRARHGKPRRVLLWTASVALLAFSWIAILSPALSSETAAPTWTHSITFPSAGKFLVSLPNEITDPIITTAAQLLEALEDTVGCDYVARHQTWDDTFLVYDNAGNCSRCDYDLTNCVNEPGGSGCGCFCIDPAEGRGFFVDVGAGTFSMTASDVTYYYMELEAPGAASLTGTNLVSLPYDLFPTTAKLLMRELDPTNVQQIERFLTTTETFQVYSFGLPDFPIGCGEGYVVKMTTTLAYVPFHTGAEPPECPVGGPAPCEQGPFPTCDGSCPFGTRCSAGGSGTDCECLPCATPEPVTGVAWRHVSTMGWNLETCSDVYKAYRHDGRLSDQDGNGVADHYGDCFRPDLMSPLMFDVDAPPPGDIRYYVVTAENSFGESSLGLASNLEARPNTTPCP